MKSLLIIAHGSRRQASNDEIRELADRVRQQPGQPFSDVSVAFLELASPGIDEALTCCVERGFTDITVLPYFLAAGRHVVEDIPAQLQQFQARHPQLTLQATEHFGASALLPPTILNVATAASES